MRPRLTVAAIATTLTAAVAVAIPADGSQQAPPPIRLARVQYDSPGDDNGSNRSLNGEWVRIFNSTARARSLTGWTIRDTSHHVYRFGHFVLGGHKSVTLHTGRGRNTARNVYWRQDDYVWNNTGDKAILKNRPGHRVDVCSWGDGPGAITC